MFLLADGSHDEDFGGIKSASSACRSLRGNSLHTLPSAFFPETPTLVSQL